MDGVCRLNLLGTKVVNSLLFFDFTAPDANKPDPSFDLVSLYGLGPIAQTVARIDPVTGEKINRLRKSYEGKLKGLGLAGRNKPLKSDTEGGSLGSLSKLMEWPEEEWHQQCVYGKQIQVADIDSALHGLQTRAMQMQPGTVPNNDFWEDVLGHEKPAKAQGDSGKKGAPTPGGRPSMTPHMPSTGSQEPERSRPSRGRKRHYDDNSFVGYGEGYADDDEDPGFYSNGEGTGKKKRKKVRSLGISHCGDYNIIRTNTSHNRTTFPKSRPPCPNEAGATGSACLELAPDEIFPPKAVFLFLFLSSFPLAKTGCFARLVPLFF